MFTLHPNTPARGKGLLSDGPPYRASCRRQIETLSRRLVSPDANDSMNKAEMRALTACLVVTLRKVDESTHLRHCYVTMVELFRRIGAWLGSLLSYT